jgi:hypothetical protein
MAFRRPPRRVKAIQGDTGAAGTALFTPAQWRQVDFFESVTELFPSPIPTRRAAHSANASGAA